jgi:hypothetical protein|nr:hypothetical protein [Phenylobacterium aquaticum]
MRTLFLFILFFINQQNQSYKIVGNLNYCDDLEEIEYGNRIIAISKDGKVINDNIKTGFKGSFEISNLSPGTYVIGYNNIFGQRVRKSVVVNNQVTNVHLCVDEFQDTKVSTLFNTMKEGDVIVLKFSSFGCFHMLEDELTFSLKDKKYSVSYKDEKNKTKILPLNLDKLNRLIYFEKIIRYVARIDGGCTTNDGYTFIKNGETIYDATDNTCSWHGYGKIREILGHK